MASTYSPNLRLELIGTGEQQGTWGSTTNTNLGTLLEEAIGGYVSVTVTDGADTTLSTNNGSADQSRNMTINLTGTLTAARNVICPAIEKVYIVRNATTGGFAVTFKVSGQTGVSIPNGSTYILYVNGTDAVLATGTIAAQNSNNVSITGGSISGITDLAIADGGTGASDAATARTNLGIGTMGTQNANAVAITGGTINAVAITSSTIVANASGISIRDADASNVMTIAVGSNLTANTTLTLTTGAATNRTLDISAANVTVSVAGAALIDDADASAQRTTLGLGTIATQNANAVSITGGSVTGITDLAVADGGTGASDAGTARTNLGLGTISTQNANAVSITGGSVTGITDLAVADGGTGASDAGTARTNLGLAIGTNVQAYSARLGEIAALAPTADNFIVGTGTSWSLETPALARTSLGLGTIATQNANAVSITGGSVTGITDITVSDGGTGTSSIAAYSVVTGGTTGTGALQTVSGTGTSGQVLTSAGANALPTWSAAPASLVSLGTATAPSGTSASITGLTLTNYRFILISYSSISSNQNSDTVCISGDNTVGFSTPTIALQSTAANSQWGSVMLELDNGGNFINTATSSAPNKINSSSTAIYFRMAGGVYDNASGVFRVYGLRV